MSSTSATTKSGMLDAWNKFHSVPIYKCVHDLIVFIEKHREQAHFQSHLPFMPNGILLLFETVPRPADFYAALIEHLVTPFYNSNILAGEDECTKGWFIQEMERPKLDKQYQALLVPLNYQGNNGRPLQHCKPLTLAAKDFSAAPLSPH